MNNKKTTIDRRSFLRASALTGGGLLIGFNLFTACKPDVELPKDVDSTMWTDTGGYNVKIASMSVSLELGWIDMSFYDLVKASTKQNLKFTLGSKTFLVKGLIFPEFNPEIKPDDLMGQVVTAVMDQPDLTIT